MTESPKVNLSKFSTLTLTERSNKIKSHFLGKKHSRKSNPSLMNPESALHFKSIDEVDNLPTISTKKRRIKKGTFLESWLDQALDSNDPQSNSNKISIDTGKYSTLHKF